MRSNVKNIMLNENHQTNVYSCSSKNELQNNLPKSLEADALSNSNIFGMKNVTLRKEIEEKLTFNNEEQDGGHNEVKEIQDKQNSTEYMSSTFDSNILAMKEMEAVIAIEGTYSLNTVISDNAKIVSVKPEILKDLVKEVKEESLETGEQSKNFQTVYFDDFVDDDTSEGSLVLDDTAYENPVDDSLDGIQESRDFSSSDDCSIPGTSKNKETNDTLYQASEEFSPAAVPNKPSTVVVFKCGHCFEIALDIQVIASHNCRPIPTGQKNISASQRKRSENKLQQALENMKASTKAKYVYTFGCYICGKLFFRNRNFRQHVRRMHHLSPSRYFFPCNTEDKKGSKKANREASTVQKSCMDNTRPEISPIESDLNSSVNRDSDGNSVTDMDTTHTEDINNCALRDTNSANKEGTACITCGCTYSDLHRCSVVNKVFINGKERYKCTCGKLLLKLSNYWRHVYSQICVKNQERRKVQPTETVKAKQKPKKNCRLKNSKTAKALTKNLSKLLADSRAEDNVGLCTVNWSTPSVTKNTSRNQNINPDNMSHTLLIKNGRHQVTCITVEDEEVSENNCQGKETESTKHDKQMNEPPNISLSILAVQGNYQGHEELCTISDPIEISCSEQSTDAVGTKRKRQTDKKSISVMEKKSCHRPNNSDTTQIVSQNCIVIEDSDSSQDSCLSSVNIDLSANSEENAVKGKYNYVEMACIESGENGIGSLHNKSSTEEFNNSKIFQPHTILIDEDDNEFYDNSPPNLEELDPLAQDPKQNFSSDSSLELVAKKMSQFRAIQPRPIDARQDNMMVLPNPREISPPVLTQPRTPNTISSCSDVVNGTKTEISTQILLQCSKCGFATLKASVFQTHMCIDNITQVCCNTKKGNVTSSAASSKSVQNMSDHNELNLNGATSQLSPSFSKDPSSYSNIRDVYVGTTTWKCINCNFSSHDKHLFAGHDCSHPLSDTQVGKTSLRENSPANPVEEKVEDKVMWGCTKCIFTSRNRQAYLLHRCSAVRRRAVKKGIERKTALSSCSSSAATQMICPGCGFSTEGRLIFSAHRCHYTSKTEMKNCLPHLAVQPMQVSVVPKQQNTVGTRKRTSFVLVLPGKSAISSVSIST